MDFDHVLDQLYFQINQCRLDPRGTANKLTQLRPAFEGKTFKGKYRTREGITALDNLISVLSQKQPVKQQLKWSFALHMTADEQATLLGQSGLFTTETTSSHRPLPQRVKQYAIIKGRISEIYEFGGRSSQQILEQLLIDDGLASRKRRNMLLDPVFKYIGIGSCYHEKNEVCTVIIMAEDIVSLVAPDKSGQYRKRNNVQTGTQNIVSFEQKKLISNILGQAVISNYVQPPAQNKILSRDQQVKSSHNNFVQQIPQNQIDGNLSNAPFILGNNEAEPQPFQDLNISRSLPMQQIINDPTNNTNPVIDNNSSSNNRSSGAEQSKNDSGYIFPKSIGRQKRQGSLAIYQPRSSVYNPSLDFERSSTSQVYKSYHRSNSYLNDRESLPKNNNMRFVQSLQPIQQQPSYDQHQFNQKKKKPNITIINSTVPQPVTPQSASRKKQQSKCSVM